jgi:UDP-2,4-diacetamido-2,4,6-trideoxy-beta-L-altropyranose hydrolase
MNILIRVDSSIEIGTGHVMRCLTLAHQLKSDITSIYFICRKLEGNINSLIEDNGFKVITLNKGGCISSFLEGYEKWLSVTWQKDAQDTKDAIKNLCITPDLFIVDHYAIDKNWELEVKPYVRKLLVIDDLANRPHDCDFLLDQNFYLNANERYQDLTPSQTKLILGPSYALLRREFYLEKEKINKRDFNKINSILIFMGGSDSDNITKLILESLSDINSSVQLKVVVGKSNPHKQKIKQLITKFDNAHYFEQVNNMASLMANSDLAIGAGGTTTWERCILGLPSLTITIAENQIQMTKDADSYGAIWYVGHKDELTKEKILETINNISPDELKNKHEKSLALMHENNEASIKDLLLEYLYADVEER